LERIEEYDRDHRALLKRLPAEVQHQVAYRSAWSLLFGEVFFLLTTPLMGDPLVSSSGTEPVQRFF
jgi:hypothetical protein